MPKIWICHGGNRCGKRAASPNKHCVTGGMPFVMIIEWGTPAAIFGPLDAQYHFTLDVCASAANAKVPRYFSAAQNGLAQDWGQEVCFMNPPYGPQLAAWMRKACESAQGGATVVCFLPARTCTRWWHTYAMRGEYTFLKGRTRFEGAASGAPFPSVIVVFRPPAGHAARV